MGLWGGGCCGTCLAELDLATQLKVNDKGLKND